MWQIYYVEAEIITIKILKQENNEIEVILGLLSCRIRLGSNRYFLFLFTSEVKRVMEHLIPGSPF